MKKAHNLNTENKLTLNKLKVTKLSNLHKIKGGDLPHAYFGDDDESFPTDTWTIAK